MSSSSEDGFEIRLSGKYALIALGLLLAFWVWRVYAVKTTVADGVRESLRSELKAEYARYYFGDLTPDSLPKNDAEYSRRLDEFKHATESIEFKSIKARGTGEDIIVRAEILVGGGPPPDGKSVRYYVYSYSAMLGWCYQQETSAWAYWLRLW